MKLAWLSPGITLNKGASVSARFSKNRFSVRDSLQSIWFQPMACLALNFGTYQTEIALSWPETTKTPVREEFW
jgi:hypothetical protein